MERERTAKGGIKVIKVIKNPVKDYRPLQLRKMTVYEEVESVVFNILSIYNELIEISDEVWSAEGEFIGDEIKSVAGELITQLERLYPNLERYY